MGDARWAQRGSWPDPLCQAARIHSLAGGEHLGPAAHLGHAHLPEGPAFAPCCRVRADDDDRGPFGPPRPAQGLFEIAQTGHGLGRTTEGSGVGGEVNGDRPRPLTEPIMLLNDTPPCANWSLSITAKPPLSQTTTIIL